MVVGWIFDGVAYHETSKVAKLRYKLGYLITATLFCTVTLNPVILITWIRFCLSILHNFVLLVDIVCIGHTMI